MQKQREASQTGENLVSEQSQGPLVPPQGLSIILWATFYEWSYWYWNAHQMEKLNTGWADCSHDISCHNSENLPQEMETNGPWDWRLTVLKIIKMMLVRPLITNFKLTVRTDCCFCMKPPLSAYIKPPGCQWRGAGLWTGVHPSPVAVLSANLASLQAFERQVARPHLQLQT